MSRRVSAFVLLPSGRTRRFRRYAHESDAEYSGRLLCEIEEAITGSRGPAPAGARWAVWYDGNPDGLGMIYESTGAPYVDRTVRVPGIYNIEEARRALGC